MRPLLSVLLLLGVTLRVLAAEAEIPRVTVFGTAVTQAQPDLLRWNLKVSDKGAELSSVSVAHASHTEAVLQFLNKKKIRPEETQTSGMRFSESREYRGNSWVQEGYAATTQVAFTLRKLADYRDMWIELSRLNVSVDSVTWDVSKRIELQNSTRAEALRNARTKAEQMADVLGAKIAEPISIEEVQIETPWASPMSNSTMVASRQEESGDAITPGAVPIQIRVRVVFRLVAR